MNSKNDQIKEQYSVPDPRNRKHLDKRALEIIVSRDLGVGRRLARAFVNKYHDEVRDHLQRGGSVSHPAGTIKMTPMHRRHFRTPTKGKVEKGSRMRPKLLPSRSFRRDIDHPEQDPYQLAADSPKISNLIGESLKRARIKRFPKDMKKKQEQGIPILLSVNEQYYAPRGSQQSIRGYTRHSPTSYGPNNSMGQSYAGAPAVPPNQNVDLYQQPIPPNPLEKMNNVADFLKDEQPWIRNISQALLDRIARLNPDPHGADRFDQDFARAIWNAGYGDPNQPYIDPLTIVQAINAVLFNYNQPPLKTAEFIGQRVTQHAPPSQGQPIPSPYGSNPGL